jgi:AcrR family transcriptional regulator
MTATGRKRRLGRPPASDSAATRERILEVARRAFADLGFESTTNKTIAKSVGITTGAIYHYFESKFDTFVAVYEYTQDTVYARINERIDWNGSFLEILSTTLEVSHELNGEDPSLARFLGSARVDFQRHPDLAAKVSERVVVIRNEFFGRVVARGVETGEIDDADSDRVLQLIIVVLSGLTDALSHDLERHREAIDAIRAVFAGTLVRAPTCREQA